VAVVDDTEAVDPVPPSSDERAISIEFSEARTLF
jgi:hypothetical protein